MLYTYLPALHTHAGLNGSYKYTLDIMAFKANKIPMSSATCSQITKISTPLNIKMWKQYLQKHPDKDFAGYILQGLQYGFSIGLDLDPSMLFTSAKRNIPSANENPKVIDEYILEETDKGNILGPFSFQSPSIYHVNRIGVMPK